MSSSLSKRQLKRMQARLCAIEGGKRVIVPRTQSQSVKAIGKEAQLGDRRRKQRALDAALDRYQDNMTFIQAQTEAIEDCTNADPDLFDKVEKFMTKRRA